MPDLAAPKRPQSIGLRLFIAFSLSVLLATLFLPRNLTYLLLLPGVPGVLTILASYHFTGKDTRPWSVGLRVLTVTSLTLLVAGLFLDAPPGYLTLLEVVSAVSLVAVAWLCGVRMVGRVLLIMLGGLVFAHLWALLWVLGHVVFVGPLIPSQG